MMIRKRQIEPFYLLAAALVAAGSGWYVVGLPQNSIFQLSRALRAGRPEFAEPYFDRRELVRRAVDETWGRVEAALQERIGHQVTRPGMPKPEDAGSAIGATFALDLLAVLRPRIQASIESAPLVRVDREVADLALKVASRSDRDLFSAAWALPVERSGATAVVTAGTYQFELKRNPDRSWRVVALSRDTLARLFPYEQFIPEKI